MTSSTPPHQSAGLSTTHQPWLPEQRICSSQARHQKQRPRLSPRVPNADSPETSEKSHSILGRTSQKKIDFILKKHLVCCNVATSISVLDNISHQETHISRSHQSLKTKTHARSKTLIVTAQHKYESNAIQHSVTLILKSKTHMRARRHGHRR